MHIGGLLAQLLDFYYVFQNGRQSVTVELRKPKFCSLRATLARNMCVKFHANRYYGF